MLSAIVLTHNEEKNILPCLKSLAFCDEILVIDDASTDKTVTLAEKQGAKVIMHSLQDDFASQRNFAMSKVKNDWVLFVDADERIDKRLQDDIKKSIQQNSVEGFFLKRRDFLWGKPLFHGENGHREILRLARKNAGTWSGKVHEVWNIQGTTGILGHYLLHYPHQSIVEFLLEINHYTSLRAKELYEEGVAVSWWDIILYPKAKFFQNYIFRTGFLDGVRGLVVAMLMSLHSFLVRGKLWELQNKK